MDPSISLIHSLYWLPNMLPSWNLTAQPIRAHSFCYYSVVHDYTSRQVDFLVVDWSKGSVGSTISGGRKLDAHSYCPTSSSR